MRKRTYVGGVVLGFLALGGGAYGVSRKKVSEEQTAAVVGRQGELDRLMQDPVFREFMPFVDRVVYDEQFDALHAWYQGRAVGEKREQWNEYAKSCAGLLGAGTIAVTEPVDGRYFQGSKAVIFVSRNLFDSPLIATEGDKKAILVHECLDGVVFAKGFFFAPSESACLEALLGRKGISREVYSDVSFVRAMREVAVDYGVQFELNHGAFKPSDSVRAWFEAHAKENRQVLEKYVAGSGERAYLAGAMLRSTQR